MLFIGFNTSACLPAPPKPHLLTLCRRIENECQLGVAVFYTRNHVDLFMSDSVARRAEFILYTTHSHHDSTASGSDGRIQCRCEAELQPCATRRWRCSAALCAPVKGIIFNCERTVALCLCIVCRIVRQIHSKQVCCCRCGYLLANRKKKCMQRRCEYELNLSESVMRKLYVLITWCGCHVVLA